MKDYKLIAKALRCSTMTLGCKVENCPYKLREAVTDELLNMGLVPDFVDEGVSYLISCDYDKLCMDASDAIERLTE